MMVVPYQPGHLEELVIQPRQAYLRAWITPEVAKTVAQSPAYTALDEHGDVIGCGGVVPVWEGRALAWSFLGDTAREHMVSITRAVRRFLDMQPQRRIEITVDLDFAEGHRWARMLGFKLDAGRLKGYLPNGGDVSLYSRVRA